MALFDLLLSLVFLGIQFPGGGMSYMLSDEGEQAQSPVSPYGVYLTSLITTLLF